MTVRMYARRKGWDLQSVTVELEHRRDIDACEHDDEQHGQHPELRYRIASGIDELG